MGKKTESKILMTHLEIDQLLSDYYYVDQFGDTLKSDLDKGRLFFFLRFVSEGQIKNSTPSKIKESLLEDFKKKIYLLFNLTFFYIEQQGTINYALYFKNELVPLLKKEKNYIEPSKNLLLLRSKSKVFLTLTAHLEIFDFFRSYKEENLDVHIKQLLLENILESTEFILNQLKIIPKNEAVIYNSVKHVIQSTFPSAKNAKSNFLKIAKEFKPDILIPEAKSVVEYKYATDENKLKITIEQIAVDAKGYTGDKDYSTYYAVFYVTRDFWGKNRFLKAWEEFNFPFNWKPIYIIGKDST